MQLYKKLLIIFNYVNEKFKVVLNLEGEISMDIIASLIQILLLQKKMVITYMAQIFCLILILKRILKQF